MGASQFLQGGWEYNMVRFLEREGYDVSYCTNVDVHENGSLILSHTAFLSVGHDEYWTWNMRANVTAGRDRGINLGFFGADTCFWQIRLEPSAITGAADRTIVGYKGNYANDPYATDADPSNDRYITRLWRDSAGTASEEELVGVEYITDPVDADIIISDASHWSLAGTGLIAGQALPGLLGYEVDGMLQPNQQPNVSVIAHSPIPNYSGPYTYSDMVSYVAPAGSTVFSIGSIQWSWGLDDYGVPTLHTSRLGPRAGSCRDTPEPTNSPPARPWSGPPDGGTPRPRRLP